MASCPSSHLAHLPLRLHLWGVVECSGSWCGSPSPWDTSEASEVPTDTLSRPGTIAEPQTARHARSGHQGEQVQWQKQAEAAHGEMARLGHRRPAQCRGSGQGVYSINREGLASGAERTAAGRAQEGRPGSRSSWGRTHRHSAWASGARAAQSRCGGLEGLCPRCSSTQGTRGLLRGRLPCAGGWQGDSHAVGGDSGLLVVWSPWTQTRPAPRSAGSTPRPSSSHSPRCASMSPSWPHLLAVTPVGSM